jgi:hypothetical protein
VTQEEAKKLLSFHEKGVIATRYKSKAIVYSNKSIQKEVKFNIENYEVRFIPINEAKLDCSQKYMPAFICEVITKKQKGGTLDIQAALDDILTWLEFDYTVGLSYEAWEEYDGEWVKSVGGAASFSVQEGYSELPKQNLHSILELYEKAKKLNSKRAKKVITIRKNLQEGLGLKDISKMYSFLCFYKVIEQVSDDLASNNYCLNDEIIRDLGEKPYKQKIKVHYLLKVIENNWSVDEMIYLAKIRNDLAHSDNQVSHESLNLCQKLAFWAAESFLEITVAEQ